MHQLHIQKEEQGLNDIENVAGMTAQQDQEYARHFSHMIFQSLG